MPDDGSDEEPVVCDLGPLLHTGGPQVQLHSVIGAGHGRQVEVTHAVQLKLERQSRLQIAVDSVLLELERTKNVSVSISTVYQVRIYILKSITHFISGPEGEVLRELSLSGKIRHQVTSLTFDLLYFLDRFTKTLPFVQLKM